MHPTGLYLGPNGALDGALDANWDRLANTYEIIPLIRNYEGPVVRSDLLANMLVDNKQRDAHINALVNLAVANLYKGIDIDYRGLDENLRGEFNQFIAALAAKLQEKNKTLSVRVEPAKQVADDRWDTGAYDWQTLGLLADTVKVPAPVDPRAYVPDGQLDALLNYATGQINRYKLQPILSGQSVEQSGNYLLQKKYSDALQPLLGRIKTDLTVVEPGKPLNLALASARPNSGLVYDPNIGTYVYRYQDDQAAARTVWLENAASLSHKLDLLKQYNIQGVTVENLPADGLDADLWRLMRDYQQGRTSPIDSNFAVQWTVKGSDGKQVSQVRPLTDPGVALAAPVARGRRADRGRHRGSRPRRSQGKCSGRHRGNLHAHADSDAGVHAHARGESHAELRPDDDRERAGQRALWPWHRLRQDRRRAGRRDLPHHRQERSRRLVPVQLRRRSARLGLGALRHSHRPDRSAGDRQAGGAGPGGRGGARSQPACGGASAAAPAPRGGGYFRLRHAGRSQRRAHEHHVPSMGNWVKFQVPWKDFEGTKGSNGFPDGWVNEATADGLNIMASIVKAPDWARIRPMARGRRPAGRIRRLCRLRRRVRGPLQRQSPGHRGLERAEPGYRVGPRAAGSACATWNC